MDQLIKAMALLISKKIDMTGLSVDDINVLNGVLELARALDEPASEKELNEDTMQAIRQGYEKYVISRLVSSYNLVDWYSHTTGRDLTDQQVTTILEADVDLYTHTSGRDLTDQQVTTILEADVGLVYGVFSVICNTIITNARKE